MEKRHLRELNSGSPRVINFAYLESHLSDFREKFSTADPFEYVVIDDFCDANLLHLALRDIQQVSELRGNRSNDYIFAKNKFEKANFDEISTKLYELKKDLLSQRFENWLSALTDQKIFVDEEFHGGGLHQGGEGSFLDMHVDFNYHPNNLSWFRFTVKSKAAHFHVLQIRIPWRLLAVGLVID